MATTTTTAKTKTTSTYNNDFSAANAYRPDPTAKQYNPDLQKAGQQSIDEYATNRGYDSPYKYNDLLDNIYNPGVVAKYNADVYGTQVAQNAYDQALNAMNRATIDAIRSETAGAVASGTSRGITDANVLKSILGLQQESVADATELAQKYRQAEVDRGVNEAQALIDASDTSWQRQNAIDAETLQLFDRMQTAYDNKYTADAGLASAAYAADSAAFSNLLATLANRVLNEETDATSVTESPDAAGGGSYYSGGNYYNNATANTPDATGTNAFSSIANILNGLGNTDISKLANASNSNSGGGGTHSGAGKSFATTPTSGGGGTHSGAGKAISVSPNGKEYATSAIKNGTLYYYDKNNKVVDKVSVNPDPHAGGQNSAGSTKARIK